MDLGQEAKRWTGDFGKDIGGGSVLAGAEGQVDLFQAAYTTFNAGKINMGGLQRPGNVEYSDIAVSAPDSSASSKLGAASDKQTEIPTITIYQYTRDGDNKPAVAEIWELQGCHIINYQPGHVGGIDNFGIDYQIIKISTFQMTADGTLKPTGTRGYNRVTHEAF